MTSSNLINSSQIQQLGGVSRQYKSGLLHTIDVSGGGTAIDDLFVAKLEGQSKLVALNLKATAISDAAISVLQSLTSLETLDLSETQITDVALDGLCNMHHLKVLGLTNTLVSQLRVREIRAAMLNTRIIYIE